MGQLRAMRRVHAHTRRRLAKSSALFMEYVLSSDYDDACVFSEVDGAHAYGEEKALEPTDDFGTSNETSLNMIHELTGSFDDHRDAPGDFVLIDDCASDWSVVTSAETDWVEVVPVAEDDRPDATANDAALARHSTISAGFHSPRHLPGVRHTRLRLRLLLDGADARVPSASVSALEAAARVWCAARPSPRRLELCGHPPRARRCPPSCARAIPPGRRAWCLSVTPAGRRA